MLFTVARRLARHAEGAIDMLRSGAELQQAVDVMELRILADKYANHPNHPNYTTARHVWNHEPSVSEQQTAVQALVAIQLNRIIEDYLRERPPPLPPHAPPPPHAPAEYVAELEALRAAVVEEQAAKEAAAQRRAYGFATRLGPSGAGMGARTGVFVEGHARAGSIVALYPGVVFTPADVMRLKGGTSALAKKRHLFALYDGAILDASPEALSQLPAAARELPLSVAHRAKHPPRGSRPNVLACPVDFSTPNGELLLPESTARLLPCLRASLADQKLLAPPPGSQQPSRFDRLDDWLRSSLADIARPQIDGVERDDGSFGALPPVRGLLLVAKDDLQDEEIFLNYRLNPAANPPDWYVPVSEEVDKRRWKNSRTRAR